MRRALKKLAAYITLLLATAVSGALAFAAMIGLTTTPEDTGALLGEKLPRWIDWLLGTPWYVPTVLLVTLFIWAAFLTWPDFKTANEVQQLRKEAREATTKAWNFEAAHYQLIEDVKRLSDTLRDTESSVSHNFTWLARRAVTASRFGAFYEIEKVKLNELIRLSYRLKMPNGRQGRHAIGSETWRQDHQKFSNLMAELQGPLIFIAQTGEVYNRAYLTSHSHLEFGEDFARFEQDRKELEGLIAALKPILEEFAPGLLKVQFLNPDLKVLGQEYDDQLSMQ